VAITKGNGAALTTIDGFHDVPSADSVANSQIRDVIGNKTDTGAGNSIFAKVSTNIYSGIGSRAIKSADCTAATPISLFTVTGDVQLLIFGICKTSLTTSDAITIEVGVAGDTACLIAQIADATALIQNEIYLDATPTTTVEAFAVAAPFIVSGGQDIILTTTGTVTAGTIAFYCFWRPLSVDGAVS